MSHVEESRAQILQTTYEKENLTKIGFLKIGCLDKSIDTSSFVYISIETFTQKVLDRKRLVLLVVVLKQYFGNIRKFQGVLIIFRQSSLFLECMFQLSFRTVGDDDVRSSTVPVLRFDLL